MNNGYNLTRESFPSSGSEIFFSWLVASVKKCFDKHTHIFIARPPPVFCYGQNSGILTGILGFLEKTLFHLCFWSLMSRSILFWCTFSWAFLLASANYRTQNLTYMYDKVFPMVVVEQLLSTILWGFQYFTEISTQIHVADHCTLEIRWERPLPRRPHVRNNRTVSLLRFGHIFCTLLYFERPESLQFKTVRAAVNLYSIFPDFMRKTITKIGFCIYR